VAHPGNKRTFELISLRYWWPKFFFPSKSKAVCFTRARVKGPLSYSLMGTLIAEANSCKYLGIILRSDLSWGVHVKYTVKKARKALHFTMRILRKGNSDTKSLAYVSLVRPILEYGATCWDPYREGQINALDRVQKKRPNLFITKSVRIGNPWHSEERYPPCVPSTKLTVVNGRGRT